MSNDQLHAVTQHQLGTFMLKGYVKAGENRAIFRVEAKGEHFQVSAEDAVALVTINRQDRQR